MNTHQLFGKFNKVIRLTDSKKSKLGKHRDALQARIKKYFEEKDWDVPTFKSQGSFPLDTNLNPIKTEKGGSTLEEYDLDEGVYFSCAKAERLTPTAYHDRIAKAVEGHTETTQDKATCVRVIYKRGHHVDLPCYWFSDNQTPELAHKSKGYIESDPIAFLDWVEKKISGTQIKGQLRRLIRLLKAWKNYRETENTSLKLPSGFILTILACENYTENPRIDLALTDLVERISRKLSASYVCYRPTAPQGEELLADYSSQAFLQELASFVKYANLALVSETKLAASEEWRKVFGDRFPLAGENTNTIGNATPITAAVNPLWGQD